jgi:hypothetical protein
MVGTTLSQITSQISTIVSELGTFLSSLFSSQG